MAVCERFGGCCWRRAPAFHLCQSRTTSAWCTKSSLNPPIRKASRCPSSPGRFLIYRGFCPAVVSDFRLFSHDNEDEGARLHFAAAFAGGRRIEIRSRKKDIVGLEVEPHGAGAALGRNIFDNGEFVGRVFTDDRKVAVAAGGRSEERRVGK